MDDLKPVVGFGAGGCLSSMEQDLWDLGYRVDWLVDANPALTGSTVVVLGRNVPVYRRVIDIPDLVPTACAVLFVGATRNTLARQRIFAEHSGSFWFVVSVSTNAQLQRGLALNQGVTILKGALVGANVHLGKNVFINTGAIVEHDCFLGDHVFVSPGAVLCGKVTVGEGTFVGANATVIGGITIGANVTIGAGSVVVRHVPDNAVVYGNPARVK